MRGPGRPDAKDTSSWVQRNLRQPQFDFLVAEAKSKLRRKRISPFRSTAELPLVDVSHKGPALNCMDPTVTFNGSGLGGVEASELLVRDPRGVQVQICVRLHSRFRCAYGSLLEQRRGIPRCVSQSKPHAVAPKHCGLPGVNFVCRRLSGWGEEIVQRCVGEHAASRKWRWSGGARRRWFMMSLLGRLVGFPGLWPWVEFCWAYSNYCPAFGSLGFSHCWDWMEKAQWLSRLFSFETGACCKQCKPKKMWKPWVFWQPEASLKARSRAGFEAKSQILCVKAVFHFVYRTIGVTCLQVLPIHRLWTILQSNFASPSDTWSLNFEWQVKVCCCMALLEASSWF